MNPTYIHTWTVKSASKFSNTKGPIPDLFRLDVHMREGGELIRYWNVHVPKTLQSELVHGEVKGIYMETLEFSSLSSRRLPGSPVYVLLGLATRAGEKLIEVPKALIRLRNCCFLGGTLFCTVGAALILTPQAWLGAISLVVGTHCWRTALQVPHLKYLKADDPPPEFLRAAER